MKSMLFRVMALSAVVAAGGYAIVQAQRHMGRSASASDSLRGPATATSSEGEPQRLPTPKDANPLRPGGSSTNDSATADSAGGNASANRVVQASGADDTTDRKPKLASPGNSVGRPNVPDDDADAKLAKDAADAPAKIANPFFSRNRSSQQEPARAAVGKSAAAPARRAAAAIDAKVRCMVMTYMPPGVTVKV